VYRVFVFEILTPPPPSQSSLVGHSESAVPAQQIPAQQIPQVNGASQGEGGGQNYQQIVSTDLQTHPRSNESEGQKSDSILSLLDRGLLGGEGGGSIGGNSVQTRVENTHSCAPGFTTMCQDVPWQSIEAALDVGRQVMLVIFRGIFHVIEGLTWTDSDGPLAVKKRMPTHWMHIHHFPRECEKWDCTLLKNLIAKDNSPYCLQNGPAKMAGHSLATAKAMFVSHTNMTHKVNLSPQDIVDWLRNILGPIHVLLGQIQPQVATKLRAKLDSIGPNKLMFPTGIFVHKMDLDFLGFRL